MAEQLIITISREYGSGGHVIAEALAKRFNLPLYDRNLLDQIAAEKHGNIEELRKYEEKPRKFLVSRTVNGYCNSPEEVIANMQFDFLRKKAAAGESFVAVGRCAGYILRQYKGLVSIFILADMDAKNKRVQEVRGMSKKEAQAAINRHDKFRKSYHNRYCDIKWGDSRNYDITINSSKLGLDRTTDMLESYIRERSGEQQNWSNKQ